MSLSGYEMIMHELSMVLSVNALMAEVREHQRSLLDAARQAGMAEMAVGALHNVGNLLNSVSVSAEEIREAARTAKPAAQPQPTVSMADAILPLSRSASMRSASSATRYDASSSAALSGTQVAASTRTPSKSSIAFAYSALAESAQLLGIEK